MSTRARAQIHLEFLKRAHLNPWLLQRAVHRVTEFAREHFLPVDRIQSCGSAPRCQSKGLLRRAIFVLLAHLARVFRFVEQRSRLTFES